MSGQISAVGTARRSRRTRILSHAVLEDVEARRLLATFVLQPHGVLDVTASDAGNVIHATFANAKLTIDVDGDSRSFTRAQAKDIRIHALGGDDLIVIDDQNTADYTIEGGAGNDTLVGGDESDDFSGGADTDTADYSARTKRLSLSLDNKSNDGEKDEHDNLRNDVEVLIGGSNNDSLTGNDLANTLRGNGGDDSLVGNPGDDLFDGGEGVDTLDYTARTSAINVAFSQGGTVTTAAGETDTLAEDDNLVILGGRGDDTFEIITARNTHVLADGGRGNDSLAVFGDQESATVTLHGGAGDDSLTTGTELGEDNFFPFGDDGNDDCFAHHSVNFQGGNGIDSYHGGTSVLEIDLRPMTTTENAFLDPAAGGGVIIGNDLDNVLSAGGPTFGGCSISGLGGNDILIGTEGTDTFVGGGGNDTVDYSGRSEDLTITLDNQANDGATDENDWIQADVENVIGGDGDDTIVGNDQRNRLDGGGGDDHLTGNGARDVLIGGNGDDTADADALDRLIGVEHIL
jgi:Ca2+-binding RTX toxin-like protein